MDNIVIATIKSWNIENAKEFSKQCKDYEVYTIVNHDAIEIVHDLKPRYIFFPHWSWKIPKGIYEKFECVAFHMADLPYGRGGSPLQNLILRKIYKTKISAFRVDDGIDTGPFYMKVPFNISRGSAEELYRWSSEIIFEYMIPQILEKQIQPVPQEGEVLEFKRRKYTDSNLDAHPELLNNTGVYDFIRMLDAEDYPRARIWLEQQGIGLLLSDAKLDGDKVTGRFEIVRE